MRFRGQPRSSFVLLVLAMALLPAAGALGQLQPGDIIIHDNNLSAVRPDGTPTAFQASVPGRMEGLATGPGGVIYFTQGELGTPGAGLSSIVRVDPLTGATTTVASRPLHDYYRGVAVEPGGSLIVSAYGGEILRVNPATGGHTTLVPAGSGLLDGAFVQLALGPDGSIYTTTPGAAGYSVVRVDPVSGARTTVASGQDLGVLRGIAVAPDGDIIAAAMVDVDPGPGEDMGRILRIDPATGQWTTLYGSARDPGTVFNVHGIAIDPAGNILAADQQAPTDRDIDGAIFRFDPVTGQRTLVYAGGALERNPNFVAVFIPEPGAAAICLGAATLALLRRRRA